MRGRAQDNARSFKEAREQRQYIINVHCTRSAGGVLCIPKVHAALNPARLLLTERRLALLTFLSA